MSYEGVPFTKPTAAQWLECTVASASTITVTVDATRNRDRGIFSVVVWTPSSKGTGKAEALAQALVKAFPVVPKIGDVSIESPGQVGRIMLDAAGWICQPITFSYRYESVA